jgi:hypothetical protein
MDAVFNVSYIAMEFYTKLNRKLQKYYTFADMFGFDLTAILFCKTILFQITFETTLYPNFPF